jgi:hypothetical protein
MSIQDTARKRNSNTKIVENADSKASTDDSKIDNNEDEKVKATVQRLQRKVYTDLPAAECWLYTCTWISCIIYAIYLFYQESLKRRSGLNYIRKYSPSWYSGILYQDTSDHEWQTWKNLLQNSKILIAVCMFPVLSQVVKTVSLHYAIYFSVAYSVIFTWSLIGLYPVLYLFIQPLLIFTVYLISNNVIAVWTTALIYSQIKNPFEDLLFDDYKSWAFQGYLTTISAAWINCRCVSFCLDRIWGNVVKEKSVIQSFIHLLAYSFYLPLGFMGPLITSKQFKEGIESKHKLDMKLVKFTVLQLLRYVLWYYVMELMMCFVYQQAFIQKPNYVRSMGMWQLTGMAYLLGQFFQLKYVIMYGTGCFLAKLDNMDAPPHPKCIGRIHLYSDMWRHFDVGLYHFMHQYIFTPLAATMTSFLKWSIPESKRNTSFESIAQTLGKTLVTISIFSFVYVWHGVQDFVLRWSVLNCAGVLAENLSKQIASTTYFKNKISSVLSVQGQRRFDALISSPLFLMSCLSNFYFFTGMQVGNIIAERTFTDTWPYGFPFLMVALYTGAQFSIQVKNWEIKREIEKLTEKS